MCIRQLDVCQWTAPTNSTSTSTSQSASKSWSYNTTPWVCTFICNTNYHTEDLWITCISDTRICTINNWVWQQTWNTWTSSWWSCNVISCNSWYSISWNSCIVLVNRYPWCDTNDINFAWYTRAACNVWASSPNVAWPAYSCDTCCAWWYHVATNTEWTSAINTANYFTMLKLSILGMSRYIWGCPNPNGPNSLNDAWYEWESRYYIYWGGRFYSVTWNLNASTYSECFQLRCVHN